MIEYAYPPVSEFKGLAPPEYNPPFGWYIMTNDASMKNLWFLAIDAHVRVRDKPTGFFFATELEAHHASVKYYDRFGEEYPYGVKMTSVASGTVSHDESQVMEFV